MGALARSISERYLGETPTVGGSYGAVLRRTFSLIWAYILASLVWGGHRLQRVEGAAGNSLADERVEQFPSRIATSVQGYAFCQACICEQPSDFGNGGVGNGDDHT
jgi:hypothetical protein